MHPAAPCVMAAVLLGAGPGGAAPQLRQQVHGAHGEGEWCMVDGHQTRDPSWGWYDDATARQCIYLCVAQDLLPVHLAVRGGCCAEVVKLLMEIRATSITESMLDVACKAGNGTVSLMCGARHLQVWGGVSTYRKDGLARQLAATPRSVLLRAVMSLCLC